MRGEALERRAELALPVDVLLAPEPAQQCVVLDGERDALADVLAEPRVDRAGVAAAEHQVHPAVEQVLERRVVLGDAHGSVVVISVVLVESLIRSVCAPM